MPALTAPGSSVTVTVDPGSVGLAAPAATAMMVGFSDRAPAAGPVATVDAGDWRAKLGGRSGAAATAADSAETAFNEGAASVLFTRVVGPAATPATLALRDRGAAPGAVTLQVTCQWPGPVVPLVEVRDGSTAGTFTLLVYDPVDTANAAEVYRDSPDVPTVIAAVNAGSTLVRLADGVSPSPTAQRIPAVLVPTPLTGGSDDRTGAGDAQWQAAIGSFDPVLGPGLMLAPGRSTLAVHAMLVAQCRAAGTRLALLDGPDLPAPGDLTSLARQDGLLPGLATPGDLGIVIGPYVTVPAAPGGSTDRVVPASAALAGLIARNDAAAGHAGRASMGRYGTLQFATGLHGAFTEAQRATIDGDAGTSGASVIRKLTPADPTQVYGFRTASADPFSYDAAGIREALLLRWLIGRVADTYVGSLIDGQGKTLSDLQRDVDAVLGRHYDLGALYGATRAQAFSTSVAAPVNTPATARRGVLALRGWYVSSPTGFKVPIGLTRRGIPAA